jgi:cobalt-zinc-cadmium efflux system outer membrane protein
MTLMLATSSCLTADVLSVDAAVQAAKDRSPDILNLRHQVQAADAQARQALSLQDPGVSASINDVDKDLNTASAGSSSYGVSQSFTFPGKALLNYSQGKDQAQALRAQLRAMELQVGGNVKNAYYLLALAKKNLDLNAEQEKILEQIVSIVKRRYEAGSVTEVDVANAQMAQYANQASLTDLVLAQKTAQVQLNLALGHPAEADLDVAPLPEYMAFPPVDRDRALAKLQKMNPQILSAASQASAAGKGLTLAWMSLLPDFQVGLSDNQYHVYSPNYASSPLVETRSLQFSANVPLWFLFNESQAILAADHSRDAAKAGLDSQQEQAQTALFTAVDTLENNAAKLSLYKDHLLPLSEATLKMALINYGTGKIQFQDLASAAAGLWSNRSTYYSLLAGYVGAYNQYGQLIGEDL